MKRKKRLLCLLSAVLLYFSLAVPAWAEEIPPLAEEVPALAEEIAPLTEEASAEDGLKNFIHHNVYTEGQFADVAAGSTFSENVKTAYELGLMLGKTDTSFDPAGSLTVAQTIVMACRIHSIYYNDGTVFASASPWYQSYLDYALENQVIANGYEQYDMPVTRSEFARILNGTLPDTALLAVNTVEEGAIPDVDMSADYSAAVYRLYRAGILTGNDSIGTFAPGSYITRGAAAAIVSRMADRDLRKSVTLVIPTPAPSPAPTSTPVPELPAFAAKYPVYKQYPYVPDFGEIFNVSVLGNYQIGSEANATIQPREGGFFPNGAQRIAYEFIESGSANEMRAAAQYQPDLKSWEQDWVSVFGAILQDCGYVKEDFYGVERFVGNGYIVGFGKQSTTGRTIKMKYVYIVIGPQ